MTGPKPTIFISFSHKDEKWRDRLVQYLRVLGGQRQFEVWHDQRIAAGDAWKAQIERAIDMASVAVLLVSVDFLDSRFIREEEVPRLQRRCTQDNLPVVPVILRPCPWEDIPWLNTLQARPDGGKPLAGRAEHEIEEWLLRIAREISGRVPRVPEAAPELAAPPPVAPAPTPESRKPTAPTLEAPTPAEAGQGTRTPTPPASPERLLPVPAPAAPAAPAVPGVAHPDRAPAAGSPPCRPAAVSMPGVRVGQSPAVQAAAATSSAAPVKPTVARTVSQRAPERVPPPRRSAPAHKLGLVGVLALAVAGAFYGAYRMFGPSPRRVDQRTSAATPGPSPFAHPPASVLTRGPSPRADAPVLHPLEFETVTVDERGAVRERRKLQAQSFTEDLGNGVTLRMVAIPGGRLTMGAPPSEGGGNEERPEHPVTIAPFYMGQFEVTQAQWRAVAALPRVTRDLKADPAFFTAADRPVERVSWHDAIEFCDRLGRKTGRDYRLPSEAEWEYAARGRTTTPFAFGLTITPDLANYNGNFPYDKAGNGDYRTRTTKVGSVGYANAFALFDMHGNVWEWVQDVWHDTYAGSPDDGRAWGSGGDPNQRVLRGGAWNHDARNCRSAVRYRSAPALRNYNLGFRVVCSVSRTQ